MWPQTVVVRGIQILINSWEDFDELIQRYGSGNEPIAVVGGEGASHLKPQFKSKPGPSRLAPHDRTLLKNFLEGSVSTNQIGQALGRKGKAIKSGLDDWSLRIGLTTDSTTTAFEPCFRTDGRGYRLTNHFRDVARVMLEEQG